MTPLKKFKDRQTAVQRIWKAVQNLGQEASSRTNPPAAVDAAIPTAAAPQTPDVTPPVAPAKKEASPAKKAPRPEAAVTGARGGSKASAILELLIRKNGATLGELMEATGWQAHSVRGFLSGTIRKKMGLDVTSTKGQDGVRSYSVIA